MNEFIAIAALCSVIGGAVGATLAKAQPWQGAITTAAGVAASGAVSYALSLDGAIIPALCMIIACGVVGTSIKMRPQQIGHSIIGAVLAVGAAYLAADTVRYFS